MTFGEGLVFVFDIVAEELWFIFDTKVD